MGIPSYYKKLLHTVPGLVSTHSHAVEWLFMDFNCLIYYCIPKVSGKEFESALREAVVHHLKEIVKEVAPTKGVYIAIDGVVPMAKMRQQRLRRFKSAWEKAQPHTPAPLSWDTNAITPGTLFMENLASDLQMICDERGWILSSAMEHGEGEHKIVSQWRTGHYKGASIALYGMDADLIVLSLLGQLQNQLGPIWLFRESPAEVECELQCEWFSIDILKTWILQGRDESFILTYCFAMSVLGNDFLPSSLGLKMREGGHDELLRCITALTGPLIDGAYQILYENLFELFRLLSQFEPHRIATYIKGKQRMANHCTEKGLGEKNWPLAHIEEGLIGPMWSTNYWKQMDASVEDACQEYLTGIRWIWAYYTGKPVCFNWFYPYSLPPLWLTLAQTGQDNRGNYSSLQSELPIKMRAQEIQPVEQLCLVLPLSSWSLIPACPQKKFPMRAPQFFPSSFTFESVGNSMFWQCHPCIPTPTPLELKAVLSS